MREIGSTKEKKAMKESKHISPILHPTGQDERPTKQSSSISHFPPPFAFAVAFPLPFLLPFFPRATPSSSPHPSACTARRRRGWPLL